MSAREEARNHIKQLVKKFNANKAEFLSSGYNETLARTDFITPFFAAFGWDVSNEKQLPLDLREVVQEPTVELHEEKLFKRPDYEFRLARQRKFFVEAKKPSVRIEIEKYPAFQVRRYGFSASLPISVLTNFHQIAIYDCVPIPREDDNARIARVRIYSFEEYDKHFDELYDSLSRESVFSGAFDKKYKIEATARGTAQFDDFFLRQVRNWRLLLAIDIQKCNPSLSINELSYCVQRILTKIIFLRICEDREIEKYETLKKLPSKSAYRDLKAILEEADKKYDSGLFRLLDDISMKIAITDDVLISVIEELYYPKSPYTFSVVNASLLGDIYELFLSEEITLTASGDITTIEKPEIRESGGVYTTPAYVVERIVSDSLDAENETASICNLKMLDICCGSGIFLLNLYENLLNAYLLNYTNTDLSKHNGKEVYEIKKNDWRLTLKEKRRILLNHIYGVDIDFQAVEVAKFSLLLKLIEDETHESLESYIATNKMAVLPSLDDNIKCGNSLVDYPALMKFNSRLEREVVRKINPFDWIAEFSKIIAHGGFDIIVANPPYIRIQKMVAYSPEEVEFYQSKHSPYLSSQSDNFDKYALFIERGLALLSKNGVLGYIVPHKFMTIKAGKCLRKLLSESNNVRRIIHFGVQQVFGSSNYTAIVILTKSPNKDFEVEPVEDLNLWRYAPKGQSEKYSNASISEEPWTFVSAGAQRMFSKLTKGKTIPLEEIAEIFVGVQTSRDEIYTVEPLKVGKEHVEFKDSEGNIQTIEPELLRPFLKDVQILGFSQPKANAVIIFPYLIEKGKAKVISEDVMKSKYPLAYKYLLKNKATLINRSIQGGKETTWYSYGRSQSLTKFNGPKLILPILSKEPRYAYDSTNIVVSGGGNGPYYLIRPKDNVKYSIHFIQAVLSHPVIEAFVRASSSFFRGGYYSHGKQFIEDIPFPFIDFEKEDESKKRHDDISLVARQLIQLNSDISEEPLPHKKEIIKREMVASEAKLFSLIDKLCGLDVTDSNLAKTINVMSE
ncbi:MAG: Eco57I restriction-modification methylase domain-containing protein [Candidatus Omnitrophica bacterium]|nr:Eco57I restriction-modification methylase domain-containing protein [Candidatus Omnitrophota bacterium]